MSAALEISSARRLSPFATPEGRAEAAALELQVARRTLARLRDPAGAIRLAVQIMVGPLRPALEGLEPAVRAQLLNVLGALETSTRELCRALETSGAANDGGGGSVPMAKPAPAPTSAPMPVTVAPRPPRACPAPAPEVAATLDVEDLLRRLEVLTVTRSSLPGLLAVDSPEDLRVSSPGPDLLQALCGLVENAVEASARAHPTAAPWTVGVRAFLDPADDLSDDLHVVFEIRDEGDGIPSEVMRWATDPDPGVGVSVAEADGLQLGPGMTLRLARRLAEDAGGRLELLRVSKRTSVRLRLPAS